MTSNTERLIAATSDRATVPGQKVAAGKLFIAGTGRLDLAVAGNVRAIFQNPSDSGKVVSLARLTVYSSTSGYAKVFRNPTAGVPTSTPRLINNAILGHANPASAILRADTSTTTALSGGTDTGLDLGIPIGRTSLDFPPLILLPGESMGISMPFAGAANGSFNIFWWED